ncbi:hypothetical protein P1J78_04030 [Psychromarinibacter sp. C21-152]|uniref:Lipoprotein n=1 Tax=Psychromarinibacter sediminicola TaxID=3033385 RepID=A0AAE3NQN7_9RHOB|nr:hypothetical protein [Psychromarinibacter sediminicola]MDF0599894.1 hypothetical protein [Psychromarinibacter sediminicola]
MGRRWLVWGMGLVLAGCVFTERPVLDESNSVTIENSPAVQAFLAAADGYSWGPDGAQPGPGGATLFSVTDGRAPDAIRVRETEGGIVLVQETAAGCGLPMCTAYYGVRVGPDGTPQLCLFDASGPWEAVVARAAPFGVTLVKQEETEGLIDVPPVVTVAGAPGDIAAFLLAHTDEEFMRCRTPPER